MAWDPFFLEEATGNERLAHNAPHNLHLGLAGQICLTGFSYLTDDKAAFRDETNSFRT